MKKNLGKFLKGELLESYESILRASGVIGIPYERFKKAIRDNKFNAEDLALLADVLPGFSLEDLETKYHFEDVRSYSRSGTPASALTSDPFEHSLRDMYDSFDGLKRLARKDGELGPTVSDLYERWHTSMAMVLFHDGDNEPVEWDVIEPSARAARKHLYNAISKGAMVIYVAETMYDRDGNAILGDKIDDNFDSFKTWLKRENSENNDKDIPGFVALLRVKRCVFCTPFQKHSLFLWRQDDDLSYRSFTTATIPETLDGISSIGTIVLPQTREHTGTMVKFMKELETSCDSEKNSGCQRASSFPPLSNETSKTGSAVIKRFSKLIW